MNQLSTEPGKILYAIYQMSSKNQINPVQRSLLKEMLFSGSESIKNAFQDYKKDGTQMTFISDLHRILKQQNVQVISAKSGKLSSRRKRSMTVIIPQRNIQKIPTNIRS